MVRAPLLLSTVARAAIVFVFATAGCGGASTPADIMSTPNQLSPPLAPAPSPSAPPALEGMTWEWILQVTGLPAAPPQVAYLDVDGFDTPAAYVAAAKANGTKTICYISVGTAESFRSDYSQFKEIANAVGKPFPGFADEFYLNINLYPKFLPIMDARLRLCQSKGFEYIEFDVMDAYQDGASVTGFDISEATEIAYLRELAERANGYGLQAVQKNAEDLSDRLQPYFGAVVFEECVRLDFCAAAAAYVAAGKPALNAEYPSEWPRNAFDREQVCIKSRAAGVSTIVTRLDLDRVSDRC